MKLAALTLPIGIDRSLQVFCRVANPALQPLLAIPCSVFDLYHFSVQPSVVCLFLLFFSFPLVTCFIAFCCTSPLFFPFYVWSPRQFVACGLCRARSLPKGLGSMLAKRTILVSVLWLFIAQFVTLILVHSGNTWIQSISAGGFLPAGI